MGGLIVIALVCAIAILLEDALRTHFFGKRKRKPKEKKKGRMLHTAPPLYQKPIYYSNLPNEKPDEAFVQVDVDEMWDRAKQIQVHMENYERSIERLRQQAIDRIDKKLDILEELVKSSKGKK